MSGPAFPHIRALVLLPSFRCDIACKHCVFESSPLLQGKLPLVHALNTIRRLKEITSLEWVGVSGGESTLDLEYLTSVAQCAQDESLKFKIVTNCGFATSRENAKKILEPLARLGMLEITISWDAFHSEFVPFENIANTVNASKDCGIGVQVNYVMCNDTKAGSFNLLRLERLGVPIDLIPLRPVGRAKNVLAKSSFQNPEPFCIGRSCKQSFNTVSITHDGNVYPCCEVGGFTDGIALGSLMKSEIEEILQRTNSFAWKALEKHGPRFFTRYASNAELIAADINEDLHDCVVCNRVFGTGLGEELISRARQEIVREFQNVIGQYSEVKPVFDALQTNAQTETTP